LAVLLSLRLRNDYIVPGRALNTITHPVIESFGIGNHQFVDDAQLFIAVYTADSAALICIRECFDDVRRWFLQNDLLLNGNKCELVVIGTAALLKSATAAVTASTFAESSLPISREVKSLGDSFANRAFSVAATTAWNAWQTMSSTGTP